ncbi:DUF1542 domain-containing protein [Lactobacillus amylovorus]|uniref:DUF1542 domain-containing protein n=1 Tax=Lactobacillus amylovorus TaxID=1604 RepID=UPI00232E4107|nr:DUF1542 domain-containing protein [Lactobacillus amylovorus]MDB6221440.1 DUF1542 domain-containing protein [Lactobacillus amylovorus]
MSKNNFQERLRKMEDTKQRFSIRKFSIGAASVLIGLTIFGMGNETVHAAEQPAQNQNGVNKEEKAKQEVSVDPKANTAQFEKVSAVKEEKPDPTPAKEQNAQDSASTQTSQPAVDSVKQNAKKTQQVGNDKAALATTINAKKTQQVGNDKAALATTINAKKTQQVGNDKTALATTINAKKTWQVGNDKAALATTINAEKTQQAGNDKAVLATTITLNEPQSSVVEITESKATVQDKNSTTVKTAQELIDAIQKGTANTINIGANIDLGTISSYTNTNISNKRNIIIQSADGKQYTVDFSGYGFNMYSNDYGVTFKNLDLYGRSYYGIVRSAGSYTFDNVNYTGPELIYTDPKYNTTVNFYNKVTAHSVGSYKESSQWSQWVQGGNTQQVIQFAGGKNTINFNSGSDVTLTTTNSNVIEVDKGTTTINVKKGAKVSLNPHTHFFPEQHRMSMDGIARGIASNGDDTTLNIDGNLDINLTKKINGLFSSDKYLSGALYLNSGAAINVNGNLNINSDGQPYYPLISRNYQGLDDPVYINGNATINVNDGGSFKVNATNIGNNYKGSIVTSNGNTTIAINHHGTFDVTGDGAKATGVSLGNGSTFTSTQPELFNISMPDGATAIAIKNGKVQFNGVKTSADSQPIGEIDITYNDGIPKVTKVTSYDEATTTATRTAVNKAKNKINLVAAGKEVDLKDIMFTKDADGNYIMSGIANTADNNGAYVYISVNGTVHQVAPTDSQTLYTVGETGDPTPSQVPYTAETGADGKFNVNLGKLKDTDQVSLYAAKDFVTSDTDTKTVSEWMTSFYRDQLQKLVDEASTVEVGSNYINATDSLKTAYTNEISDGSALLQNPSATSEQLEAAATAITTAKTALNGDLNKVKQALQAAVDAAPDFENTSATYYNAASAKQQAYNTAISDGSGALKAQNPTVESLTTALNKINEAKNALDGQPTDKQALQAAVNKSKDVKDSNNYANADQNAKTAYDNAVTAAQGVLDNSNATQAQVTQALQDLNTANGKLNGDAKTEAANRQALEDAVKEAPTVEKTDSKYYNGTEKAQDDYKNTVSEGQKVLDNANATADQIKTALDNINAAKGALDGDPTNKTILQNSVDNAVDLDKSNADAQAKKDYTDALNKAKQVLAYPNASQQAVNEANAALTNAKTALDNSSALQNAKDALQRAVDAKSTTEKTPAYYNAASAKQQAYNTAISAGSDALKAQNPTVESLTDALNKINDAKSALDGKATDTSKLKAAVDNANTVKASNDYKDASADDQKQYDDAVKAGQQLLDPTTAPSPLTQADVDRAAKAITDAQSALTTSATTNVKDAKGKATADLTNAVDASKKAIDQDTNLTEDERNAAKAQVDSDASAAKEAINKATTNDAVTSAATAGKVTIDKTVANAAIDNAAAGKNKAIDGSSLTDEEKNGIKDQVAQAVKTAKDIISAADTEQAVTTAQKNGVAAIDGIKVPTESATKTAADKAIDEALANKQAEINKSTTLTDEEKANLNQQAQNAANTAKQNIANAKTDSAVATAQDNGVAAIDGIKVSANSTAKDQAKSNITDAADKAKQTIDQDNNLTNDQKQAAKAQVDADAKTAQEAINKATTNDDVTSATNTGKLAIDKAVANAAIDNAVAGKKAEISNAKDLSSDDVKALNNEVDQAANDAKNAISSATTEKAVKTAQTDGVDKINAIDVATTAAKDKAKSDIDQTANDAKKAIDDNKDLTDDQKTAAKDQIDQDATKAKDNINNAKTDKDVEDANNAGQLAIAKDGAKAAIQGALNKKLNEIDSASALTSDEKAKLTNDANTAATNANKAIDAATTPIEVTSAQTAGIQDIENVKVPAESTTKDQAKSNITDAADKAKQTIDQDNNLTNDQKQAAKDQVDTDAKNAQDAIDNAKTDADVNNAADNGKIAIDKTVADATIDNAVAGKIKDVKAPLTTDEQKTLTDLIKETGENAKQNIANATTPAEVTIAQDAGVNAIDQINVPTTSPVKDAADKAIDEALKNKTAAINKADNITDQEKHSLIDKVNKAADDATSAIKNATTDNAVKDAETKGLNEINGVTIPTLAEKQQAANVAIDQAAKAKKAEIAKALQAGNIDQAKADSLNTEVDNDVTNAMKAIANATTNAAVVVAQNDGIHKIKAIKVPSSTYNPDITNNTSTGSGDTDSTSTKPAEEATLKLILTHNAYIYNKDYQITYKDNKRVVLKKGTQIIALDNGKKYLIKGKEFYRIGDNQYVKVSNTISYYYLVHNSFLYNKHGKTIKRNGKRILVRKGVRLEANKVKVVKINGKKFYKVGKSTYIKFRNVKLIISPNN